MSITEQVEKMLKEQEKNPQFSSLQKLSEAQQQYQHLLNAGVIQKRGYNLASVDALGCYAPTAQ